MEEKREHKRTHPWEVGMRWARRPFQCKWLSIHTKFTRLKEGPDPFAPYTGWKRCDHCFYEWVG